MRDRLIELIDKVLVKYDRGCLPFVMNEIADHLIANGVTVQEWISVKDRLPEKHGQYLAVVPSYLVGFAPSVRVLWYSPKKFFYDCDTEWGDIVMGDVTHWMPLPQPPKGE